MNPERDLHDATLAALLHEHAAETPAASIDAAVRAAAHRAIERAPTDRAVTHARAQQAWRWWMPLAAAAVIGVIVIGVMPLAPSIVDDTPQRASDMPAESTRSMALTPAPTPPNAAPAQPTEAAAPAPAQKAATTAPRKNVEPPPSKVERARPPSLAQSQSRDAAGTSTQGASRAPPAPPTFAPPPSLAAAAPPRTDAPARADTEQRADAGTEVGRVTNGVPGPKAEMPTAERSKSATAASAAADMRARSIADWIARLRALRNAGDADEALRELRRYRAAFDDADARLPPDLAEWARSRR
jgi:hypothetical protein